MAQPVNFTQFILTHDEAIFGSKWSKKGMYNVDAYRKQINALNIKMNEFMERPDPTAKDPLFLLGLFDMAINQFGITVKTDLNRYKLDFFTLLEKEAGIEVPVSAKTIIDAEVEEGEE